MKKNRTFIKTLIGIIILLIITTTTHSQETSSGRLVFRVSPLVCNGIAWIEKEFIDSKYDCYGIAPGIELSLGIKVTPELIAGGSVSYMIMIQPQTSENSVEITENNFLIFSVPITGFVRYYFIKDMHIFGGIGAGLTWGAGEDDILMNIGNGLNLEAGIGYDNWFTEWFGIGITGSIIYDLYFAGYYTAQIIMAPKIGVSFIFR